ncbi:type I-C CRISPR-associated endonuclease Cas1 [Alkaliphilus pronyensis]|uniref:CRISPR-associated endonuclease Cas1 n=1 Tax=Alkaliphilus pronyensis TaxID=1482732 RepID=A0A6I0F741_9FIRM|nr:type I-C CRISPR-associated endonuclease Cas1c [Alkaliphilus pronyensis]KAB3529676.1 type I-C CRISPR-associated endonuclease Cas1 [Alkaliphilus pronyensis]
MRKLLNTIYVTLPNIYISKKGETILFKQNKNLLMQLPIHNIEGIVVFGPSTITPDIMEICTQRNVHISFISYTGKFMVKLQNPIHGNVRLRRTQYRIADNNNESIEIGKNFMLGKIFNSRTVLQRLKRDHSQKVNVQKVGDAISSLASSMKQLDNIKNIYELLGLEGEAAKCYYGVFNELITDNQNGLVFTGRSRRPPKDEVNALLSFFYTLLAHDVEAALETVGLDPQVGFYHQERPGRASLALDMMEELRPYLVDRFVVTLINNRQVTKQDFLQKESGAFLLKPEVKKKILQSWQHKKQEILTHPYLKEKIEIGLIPYAQAMLLARHLRGDIDGYPTFLMR